MYDTWDTETLVKAVSTHEAEAKRLTEVAQEMREILRERLDFTTDGDAYEFGDYEVTVIPNKRFNAKKALSLTSTLSESEREAVLTETVDSAVFKVLFPDLYALAQDEGKARITIKEAE